MLSWSAVHSLSEELTALFPGQLIVERSRRLILVGLVWRRTGGHKLEVGNKQGLWHYYYQSLNMTRTFQYSSILAPLSCLQEVNNDLRLKLENRVFKLKEYNGTHGMKRNCWILFVYTLQPKCFFRVFTICQHVQLTLVARQFCFHPSSLLLLYVNWVWSTISRNREPSCVCPQSAKKTPNLFNDIFWKKCICPTASHNILERAIMCVCARSILNNTYCLLKALTRQPVIRFSTCFDTQQRQHLWTDHESAGNFVWRKGKW